MEKVLILDNYDSFTYNLVHYVKEHSNFEVDVFRNDKISLILKALIKQYAPTKKILGVCLGMQAIGEVFGGNLVNLETVFHGVSTPIQVTKPNDLLYKGLPDEFNVGRYHSWVVATENFPEELDITSTEKNEQIMSLKHQDYKLYGVQYHPESILTEHGKKMIHNFLEI